MNPYIRESLRVEPLGRREARVKTVVAQDNTPVLSLAQAKRMMAANGWTLGRECRIVGLIPVTEYARRIHIEGRPLHTDDRELDRFLGERPEFQTCKRDTGKDGRIIVK